MSRSKGNVLVVDDTPAYLQALQGMLRDQGYRVRPVTNGRLALRAVEAERPDLILLDIDMPDLNGFETCQSLRADPRFGEIPVIFLSALSETSDKVRAFEVGGVDYVTKPFESAEVLARVETHLRIHRLQEQLAAQFADLKRLESLRDSLTHMIVHDLRSPLTGILLNLQLLETSAAQLGADDLDSVKQSLKSTRSLVQMISALLDVNKMEAGEMPLKKVEADLAVAVAEGLQSLSGLVTERNVSFQPADGPVTSSYDKAAISRVVANLVANALKFTPEDGTVAVRVTRRAARPCVEVIDTGPGIPSEYRTRIFEKFGQVESQREGVKLSTGLGLAFCKLAVGAHGGEIGVDSVVGEGSTFWFTLP
jgi:two-component system, sensor histidine kinase and response regulator